MSERCYRCFRPLGNCFCGGIVPQDTGIKFVFLMHPKEAYKQKTGTGRLSALSLAGSEILVGINFDGNARLAELISARDGQGGYGDGKGFYPVVLYPSANAWHSDDSAFREALAGRRLLVIILDATWFFARKILNLSACLRGLPCLSFGAAYRSEFRIKRQPAPECLSTIESAAYLIRELKEAGLANRDADETRLLSLFRSMVDFQIGAEQARQEALAAELYPDLFKRE